MIWRTSPNPRNGRTEAISAHTYTLPGLDTLNRTGNWVIVAEDDGTHTARLRTFNGHDLVELESTSFRGAKRRATALTVRCHGFAWVSP